MRREILAVLLLALVSGAALDQTYVQTVSRNGTSVIEKSMQITIFSNQLTADALAKMDAYCKAQKSAGCSVDVAGKTVTMSDVFPPGGYYEFSSDYGLPFITHTVKVTRVPTDRFSSILDGILRGANVTSSSGGSAAALDLLDAKANRENAKVLRQLGVNITYAIVMPSPVSEASSGNYTASIDGQTARFDLVEVLDQSQPMVVRSNEANLGYLTVIAGAIVIVAIAISFMGSKTVKRKG